MKVTMFTREYPPYTYGGAGVHLKYLAGNLSKMMDVEVRSFGDQLISEKSLNVKGYECWEKLRGKKFSPAMEALSINLLSAVDKVDSDIVHTHTWYAHFAGLLAKILYKVPYVATCHTVEPLRPWKEDQLGRGYALSSWIEKIGIESADRVIGVSKAMKEDVLKHFNIPEEKIEVIHNGIDLNKWHPTPLSDALKKEYGIKDDYILFVGRPTPQKGMEVLIDAADKIPVQIVFAAVGADTKDYEEKMMKKVKSKKNIVWIHKLLKEEEYVQLYSGARVFVCPSIYEPFGIITLEAMACKIPVVASAVGGILEVVVPEETGILVEPGNCGQIADAVNRLLKNRSLAKTLGENGRRRAEKYFSWEFIAKKVKKLYETLIK